jgi:hypothetical protein
LAGLVRGQHDVVAVEGLGEGLAATVQAWLRPGFDALAAALPSVTRLDLVGLDHGGSADRSKTNPGGRPEVVASTVGRFFEQ